MSDDMEDAKALYDIPDPNFSVDLAPLAVTVQGHSVLVAEFLKRLEEVVKPFSLDKVTSAYNRGGVDGFSSVEWVFGFSISADDLLAGEGARYVGGPEYNLPKINLESQGIQILKSRAIKAAIRKREQETAMLAAQYPLPVPEFGQPIPRRKGGRPKGSKNKPKGSD